MDTEPSLRPPTLELKNLFRLADHQEEIPWKPYKKGVDIFRLYGDGITGPTAALIRYRKCGEVPLHEHRGYENILSLADSQRDGNGVFEAGTLIINAPGTRHKVSSENGCIVLAIYEKLSDFSRMLRVFISDRRSRRTAA
jgi:anti-sigma factor ChrR (cupin superfamily)